MSTGYRSDGSVEEPEYVEMSTLGENPGGDAEKAEDDPLVGRGFWF